MTRGCLTLFLIALMVSFFGAFVLSWIIVGIYNLLLICGFTLPFVIVWSWPFVVLVWAIWFIIQLVGSAFKNSNKN